jgi:glutamine amidotransferase
VSVVIVDYGSGNLRSAAKAFERAVAEADLKMAVRVSGDPRAVAAASHVVLPGVGAFGDCRRGLDAIPGMVEALARAVHDQAKPFLGICVGMQLMADRGLEHGTHAGFGWIPGEVSPLSAAANGLKIPHMGWNELVAANAGHRLVAAMPAGAHAYFVHSFVFRAADPRDVLMTVDYGGPVTAMIGRDNLIGTQFHPEKSQRVGLSLIANFLRWRP